MSKLQRYPQYIYYTNHLIPNTEVNLAFNTIRPALAMQNACKGRYSSGRNRIKRFKFLLSETNGGLNIRKAEIQNTRACIVKCLQKFCTEIQFNFLINMNTDIMSTLKNINIYIIRNQNKTSP